MKQKKKDFFKNNNQLNLNIKATELKQFLKAIDFPLILNERSDLKDIFGIDGIYEK